MKVFLSGCHGVGKTTIVNKITTGLPLIKIVDSDLMVPVGQGFSQQMIRIENNLKLLRQISQITYPVIIDRYFGDNWIYLEEVIKATNMDELEQYLCRQKQQELMNYMSVMKEVMVVYIRDGLDVVWKRILGRQREEMMEENYDWTSRIYQKLEEAGLKYYTVHVDEAIEKIKPLLY